MGIDVQPDWRKASISGDSEAVAHLLASGVNCDERDRYGQTALMLAALHGRDEVVRLLLRQGAELNVTAKYGLSALMLAVINRHTDVAKQLVDAGADLSIRGRGAPGFADKTAHQMAVDGGLTDLVEYISLVAQRQSLD